MARVARPTRRRERREARGPCTLAQHPDSCDCCDLGELACCSLGRRARRPRTPPTQSDGRCHSLRQRATPRRPIPRFSKFAFFSCVVVPRYELKLTVFINICYPTTPRPSARTHKARVLKPASACPCVSRAHVAASNNIRPKKVSGPIYVRWHQMPMYDED